MNSKSSSPGVHQDIPRHSKVGNGQTLALAKGPLDIEVKLDLAAWEHIQAQHPEITRLKEVMKALESPQIIQRSSHRENTLLYYRLTGKRWRRSDDLYMTVVVGLIGTGRGVVRTAHLSRRLTGGGGTIWINR